MLSARRHQSGGYPIQEHGKFAAATVACPHRSERRQPRSQAAAALLASFVAGCGSLALEVAAGRVLAPYVGVSLYTWTTVIGVVMAGAAVGSCFGGRLADRFATRSLLSLLLTTGGLSSIASLVVAGGILDGDWLPRMPLIETILSFSAAIFLPPSLVLGAVSPVAARLATTDRISTGRAVGGVYAASAAGALAGAFGTGLYLVEALGSRGVLAASAALLFATSAALLPAPITVARLAPAAIGIAGVGATLALGGSDLVQGPCLRESAYHCIQVRDAQLDRGPAASLVLDRLVHSRVSPIDPTFLGYSYLRIYAAVTQSRFASDSAPGALFVGGGAYGFPRYLEATYPRAGITVLEIDPQVTAVSRDLLGLRPDSRIRAIHRDARGYLIDQGGQQQYDLVYGDAFNDLSIPYHLTTVEFDRLVYSSLSADGIYMLNVIDDFEHGDFLRAVTVTMREAFDFTYLIRQGTFTGGQPETAVVVGTKRPLDFGGWDGAPDAKVVLNPAELAEYLGQGRGVVLSDDYAPVDQMLAPLFLRRERILDAPR